MINYLGYYCSLAQCKYDCRAIYKFAKDIHFSPQLEGQNNSMISSIYCNVSQNFSKINKLPYKICNISSFIVN
jgi:hypothetical protein